MPLRWINIFVCFGIGLILFALLLPPLEEGRLAARRAQSRLMLRHIGLSLENYHDVFRHLPPGSTTDDSGQGLHGWTTLILPYLESSPLYHRVDFEIPWDHWSNRHLFQTEIASYLNPNVEWNGTAEGLGLIHFAANSNLLYRNSSVSWQEIPQGRGACWMLGEAQGDFLPWGAPFNWRNWDGTLCVSSAGFGIPAQEGANILFADGSVKFVSSKNSVSQFKDASGGLSPVPQTATQKPVVQFELVRQIPTGQVRTLGLASPNAKNQSAVLLLSDRNGEVATADFTFPASKFLRESVSANQVRIALSGAPTVRIVILDRPLDAELCSILSESPNLECLQASELNLTSESIPLLARLPQLKAVRIHRASDETLALFKRLLPRVEFLVRERSGFVPYPADHDNPADKVPMQEPEQAR